MKSLAVATITLPKRSDAAQRRGYSTAPGRQNIALPKLPKRRSCANAYDYAAVDKCGRIVAPNAIAALGWQPGMLLSVSELGGLILFKGDGHTNSRLTRRGHLKVPFPIVRWYGLESGARMFVVAEPNDVRIVIHPPLAIDAMVAWAHGAAFGGEPS